MTRTSACSSVTPPTRRKVLFSRRRSSLAWPPGGRSPISSSMTEPPSADSKRPRFWVWASVKAPRSWPKSSLSRRCSGRAAQLTCRKGRSRRPLSKWMARATTSLPAPLSPSMSTVVVSEPERRGRPWCAPARWPRSCPRWPASALAWRRSAESTAICRRVRAVARARSTAAVEGVELEGLDQEVDGAVLHGLHRHVHRAVGRHHQHRQLGVERQGPLQRLHPVDAGQLHVEQHDVGRGGRRASPGPARPTRPTRTW